MTKINNEIKRIKKLIKNSKELEFSKLLKNKYLEDPMLDYEETIKEVEKEVNCWISGFNYSRQLLRFEYLKDAQNLVENFNRPLSVTFSFIGSEFRVLELMEERFNTLLHKTCKSINKNKHSKHGVWIKYFSIKEFDNNTRGHIHSIFNVPVGISYDVFIEIIQSFWNNLGDLRSGYINLKYKPKIWKSKFNSADDALDYLFKEQTKDYSKDYSSFIIP